MWAGEQFLAGGSAGNNYQQDLAFMVLLGLGKAYAMYVRLRPSTNAKSRWVASYCVQKVRRIAMPDVGCPTLDCNFFPACRQKGKAEPVREAVDACGVYSLH
jgi:hypothetical protein